MLNMQGMCEASLAVLLRKGWNRAQMLGKPVLVHDAGPGQPGSILGFSLN